MLTNEEILTRAPAAGATSPALHCSSKFVMVNTMETIEALRKMGFVPVEARQDAAPSDRWSSNLHCRHLVRLRMKDTERLNHFALAASCAPEAVITNASDGSTRFKMDIGIWRKVCNNGLVVSDAADGFAVKHEYITAADVIERARQLSKVSLPLFEKITRWSRIKLNDEAQEKYGHEALALRLGEERARNYDVESVLAVRRDEDKDPTLWNIYNRAQEAGMKGLITGHARTAEGPGRALRTRPLTGIKADLQFNMDLWAMTERWGDMVK